MSVYGHILSVDDESETQEHISAYLEDSGFIVYKANHMSDVLSLINTEHPDLVIIDLQSSPHGQGIELIELIKKDYTDLPFIVTSTTKMVDEVIEALRLGALDYIPKPILNMAVLEHAVCRALERCRLRMELERKNNQLRESLNQLKEDQDAGKNVQQKLLPLPLMKINNYTISYSVIPSLYLSGDFVDYFEITKEKLGFYVADVSGHGASSAFVTVLLKSLVAGFLNEYQKGGDDKILRPDAVLKQLSQDILNAKLGKYLTMIYCVLDLKENTLVYSVGGHYPNPLMWDGEKAFFLTGNGFAVGIYKDAQFESITYPLPKNFSLAFFSDGVFEILKGNNLTEKEQSLQRLFASSPENIKDILVAIGVDEKGGPDDITLLLMKGKAKCSHQTVYNS